ncbi:MAG: branched-chain amino acid ABC transporter permease [Acidimicrobiales bacterium]
MPPDQWSTGKSSQPRAEPEGGESRDQKGGELVEIAIWSGLTQGAVFALVAMGFILSMLPSGVLNFAQGALVVGGAYLAYVLLAKIGMPAVPALLVTVAAGLVLGMICELVTVRPLRRGSTKIYGSSAELVTTIGMALALSGLYALVFGDLPLRVPFIGSSAPVRLPGVRVLPVQIGLVLTAVLVAMLLYVLFGKTRLGQACLAIAEDREAVSLRGINVNALSIGGFAAAGASAALSAFLVGPVTYAIPTLANSLALGGFVALAIGGQSSFVGALLGGLGIGIISSLAVRYLGSNYSDLSVLILLLVTLLFRPAGVATRGVMRHV